MDKQQENGPKKILNWILRECAKELSEPKQIIVQISLDQRNLPEVWE